MVRHGNVAVHPSHPIVEHLLVASVITPVPFSRLKSEFLEILSGPRYSPAYRKKMDQVLRQVAELGVETTDQLTTALATRYATKRSLAVTANTVRGELTYLRAAINFARDEDWLDRGPKWRRIWPRKSRRVRKVLHPIADVAKVLDHLQGLSETWDGHRLYAAAATAALGGLRRGEVLKAQVADVDLVERVIWVTPHHRLKTEASERAVPICDELANVLRPWLWRTGSICLVPNSGRNGPWLSGGKGQKPTERLVAAGMAVGVEGFTFQSLRHTFATHGRRRWGIPGDMMRDLLGHTTIGTHEAHYLHSRRELAELRAAVKGVGYRQS